MKTQNGAGSWPPTTNDKPAQPSSEHPLSQFLTPAASSTVQFPTSDWLLPCMASSSGRQRNRTICPCRRRILGENLVSWLPSTSGDDLSSIAPVVGFLTSPCSSTIFFAPPSPPGSEHDLEDLLADFTGNRARRRPGPEQDSSACAGDHRAILDATPCG